MVESALPLTLTELRHNNYYSICYYGAQSSSQRVRGCMSYTSSWHVPVLQYLYHYYAPNVGRTILL
jgi:hypothetical protein